MISWVITTHCRLYSNTSQIFLLYETWRYYNKFDSTKSSGVHCRCVKITQCGYMEHGLKGIPFYVQYTYDTLKSCHNFPAGSRQAARGARICETSLLLMLVFIIKNTRTVGLLSVAVLVCTNTFYNICLSVFPLIYVLNIYVYMDTYIIIYLRDAEQDGIDGGQYLLRQFIFVWWHQPLYELVITYFIQFPTKHCNAFYGKWSR